MIVKNQILSFKFLLKLIIKPKLNQNIPPKNVENKLPEGISGIKQDKIYIKTES